MTAKTCALHPAEAAAARCTSCSRGLCSECWQSNLAGRPWCEVCLQQLTSAGSRWPLALVFGVLSVAAGVLIWHRRGAHAGLNAGIFWLCYGVAVALLGWRMARRRLGDPVFGIEPRSRAAADAAPAATRGWSWGARGGNAAWRRAARLVASPLSGVWTAALLVACMSLVAVALPGLLHWPRWLEAETVISVWWAAWAALLSVLLYRGWRLSDDHVLAPPRVPWSGPPARGHGGRGSNTSESLPEPLGVTADVALAEPELFALLFLLGVLAGLAWFLVELLLPALFFLAYLLVRTSLARVANDAHGCERRLGRALGWGVFWASAYALPLAAGILLLHRLALAH